MTAVHDDRLPDALGIIDDGHVRADRHRQALRTVADAVNGLVHTADHPHSASPLTVGDLARRLRIRPATLRNWEVAGILTPARDRTTGHRLYHPDDVRDAELAHLLRRGGTPLDHIAVVVTQVRTAGGTAELARSLDAWRDRLTTRGLAMLHASAQLSAYLER